jgi:hypothetical protein
MWGAGSEVELDLTADHLMLGMGRGRERGRGECDTVWHQEDYNVRSEVQRQEGIEGSVG